MWSVVTLAGKVIAVAGAAGTLGPALAARFLAEDAELVALGDIDAAAIREVAGSVDPGGQRTLVVPTDVTDGASVDALLTGAAAAAGHLDVLVNNAGILNRSGRIHNLTDSDWDRVIAVNLMGTVHGIRSAVNVMRRQEQGGSVINTASAAGLTAWAYAAPYAATKAAVIHLTKVAAVEYARERIRFNCVCPGTFRSAIHDDLPPDALEAIAARHPLGLGAPTDLVGAYSFLASDASRWTTGSALVVDGGYSAP